MIVLALSTVVSFGDSTPTNNENADKNANSAQGQNPNTKSVADSNNQPAQSTDDKKPTAESHLIVEASTSPANSGSTQSSSTSPSAEKQSPQSDQQANQAQPSSSSAKSGSLLVGNSSQAQTAADSANNIAPSQPNQPAAPSANKSNDPKQSAQQVPSQQSSSSWGQLLAGCGAEKIPPTAAANSNSATDKNNANAAPTAEQNAAKDTQQSKLLVDGCPYGYDQENTAGNKHLLVSNTNTQSSTTETSSSSTAQSGQSTSSAKNSANQPQQASQSTSSQAHA